MTNKWFEYVLETTPRPESSLHPHVVSEGAERFHAWDSGSTEMEYLTLLHALVLANKPLCVVETGTAQGLGTLAIASALNVNGVGKLWTIDTGEVCEARQLISAKELDGQVEFVKTHSIKFLADCEMTFDMAFFDSDHPVRRREYLLLKQRGHLSKDAICAFHDTSLSRIDVPTDESFLAWLSSIQRLEFKKSRGLTIISNNWGQSQ